MSKILDLTRKYSRTFSLILKSNQLPSVEYQIEDRQTTIKILMIDFTPHLINYLLNDLIQQHLTNADLAYSLAYKLSKLFEINNSLTYKAKKIPLSELFL